MVSSTQEIPFGVMPESFLPHGMGRSMGDCCLNDGNVLLTTAGLNRFLAWDPGSGLLRAESGVSLDALLNLTVPAGWFAPVTPGTRFVSLGGCVANDVHGKNHHCAGTFGKHVTRLQLRRSDGSRLVCSREENPAWFQATIGGLGLTGLIEWVELQLRPIINSWIDSEIIRYGGVDEFFALNDESVAGYEYVVAWLDTVAGRGRNRGLFIRGNHNQDSARSTRLAPSGPSVSVPIMPPISLLNHWTMRGFNSLYYWAHFREKAFPASMGTFFYPLDVVGAWHRVYGPSGLLQWQGLVPDRDAVREILRLADKMGGSSLAVMKVMGDGPAPGLLSFSGRGTTIALDFPRSPRVLRMLPQLDQVVAEVGGRLYPAKDARMSGQHYRQYYPQWTELLPFIDPKFSSSFWRRVTAGA